MRVIIYGTGAIGGAIGGHLALGVCPSNRLACSFKMLAKPGAVKD